MGGLRRVRWPRMPSGRASPLAKPCAGRWQLAHATVLSADRMGSKNSFRPRFTRSAVDGLSGTAGRSPSPNGIVTRESRFGSVSRGGGSPPLEALTARIAKTANASIRSIMADSLRGRSLGSPWLGCMQALRRAQPIPPRQTPTWPHSDRGHYGSVGDPPHLRSRSDGFRQPPSTEPMQAPGCPRKSVDRPTFTLVLKGFLGQQLWLPPRGRSCAVLPPQAHAGLRSCLPGRPVRREPLPWRLGPWM